jgi:hypothetical protein
MTPKRYDELFNDINLHLTPEEEELGWYFSSDYDGLLVNRYWEGHEVSDEEWGNY